MENKHENVRRMITVEQPVFEWLYARTSDDTNFSDVVVDIIKEYIYNDNFNHVTDYIFRHEQLAQVIKDTNEQKFFDCIAQMAYNGRFDVIPLEQHVVDSAIEEAIALSKK